MPRISKRKFRLAVDGSKGIISVIARRLGCSRQTVYNYMERYPEFKELIDDEREEIIDLAEFKLLKHVNAGELRAILFVLESLGKNRGWSKRTEVTGADGAALGLSPEIVALMAQLGISESDVVREFEALIRAQAEQEA